MMTSTAQRHIGHVEFVALSAMMFATVAFSMDAMLPALPEIAAETSPDAPNRAQLILTSFMLGMGLGTFFTGPLSDSFGRRRIIAIGSVVYCISAFVAWYSSSIEVLLIARFFQGIGAAGPRVVAMAVIRDLFEGRTMARIMSFVMMVFTLVPAVAPLAGSGIIAVSGWRGIFLAFIGFSLVSLTWMYVRLPETLALEDRRTFSPKALKTATGELFSYPAVRISIAVQVLCFAMLFSMLSMVQPIYDVTFARADSFPIWFAVVALVAGTSSLLNAAIVMRLGMRRVVTATLAAQTLISLGVLIICLSPPSTSVFFAVFVIWQVSIFFQAGLVIGNLNAMAMEPVGHIAGLAASIMGGIATIGGAMLAIPVGLMFNGSPLPLAAAITVEAGLAVILMRYLAHREASGAVA